MEVPKVSIKLEGVDNIILATESNKDYKSKILDLMEIKIEPVKLEPGSDDSKSNNLDQKLKLSKEETKIIGYGGEHMLECSISPSILVDQQQHKEATASCSKKKISSGCKTGLKRPMFQDKKPRKVMYKCDQCNYETTQKHNLKDHILKHNLNKVNWYKCDKCDYQTVSKYSLKRHILRHKNPDEVEMYKCDKCDYQTVLKCSLKRHFLRHKNPDEVEMYKCYKCDYQTVFKYSLKRHILKHKNPDEVKMYKCDQCNYQIAYKGGLRCICLYIKK